MGLAGYHRRFVATPLNQLIKKVVKFVWSGIQQEADELLKEKSREEPLLQRPDFSQRFILTTDASGFAVGGILSQGEMGKPMSLHF